MLPHDETTCEHCQKYKHVDPFEVLGMLRDIGEDVKEDHPEKDYAEDQPDGFVD